MQIAKVTGRKAYHHKVDMLIPLLTLYARNIKIAAHEANKEQLSLC